MGAFFNRCQPIDFALKTLLARTWKFFGKFTKIDKTYKTARMAKIAQKAKLAKMAKMAFCLKSPK